MPGPLNPLASLRHELGVALHRRMRDEAEAAIAAARPQLLADAAAAAGATGEVAPAAVADAPGVPVGDLDGRRAPGEVAAELGLPPAVDLETEVGRLYAHRDDLVITPELEQLGRWQGDEPEHIVAALTSGDAVIDVGANIGYMTLAAAVTIGPSGHVLAIEPDSANAALLAANVRRNGLNDRVTVINAAAWSFPGVVELSLATENTGDHRVDAELRERASVRVPAVCLDDVADPARRVRLIKLDTQGTEHVVLRGARALLARDRPTILLEFWPTEIRRRGDDPAEVLRGYRAHGYAISVIDEPSVDAASDQPIIDAMDRRPAPCGGFGTLRLDPVAPTHERTPRPASELPDGPPVRKA